MISNELSLRSQLTTVPGGRRKHFLCQAGSPAAGSGRQSKPRLEATRECFWYPHTRVAKTSLKLSQGCYTLLRGSHPQAQATPPEKRNQLSIIRCSASPNLPWYHALLFPQESSFQISTGPPCGRDGELLASLTKIFQKFVARTQPQHAAALSSCGHTSIHGILFSECLSQKITEGSFLGWGTDWGSELAKSCDQRTHLVWDLIHSGLGVRRDLCELSCEAPGALWLWLLCLARAGNRTVKGGWL